MFKPRTVDPKFGLKHPGPSCFKTKYIRSKCSSILIVAFSITCVVLYLQLGQESIDTSKFFKNDRESTREEKEINYSNNETSAYVPEYTKINEKAEENLAPSVKNLKLDDGITEEAARFAKELGLINPGDGGLGVELPKNLSEEIQRRVKEGFDKYRYNGEGNMSQFYFQCIFLSVFSILVFDD
jgi:hypothetical protein